MKICAKMTVTMVTLNLNLLPHAVTRVHGNVFTKFEVLWLFDFECHETDGRTDGRTGFNA